jgi:A/G-specific adenine glycosylase
MASQHSQQSSSVGRRVVLPDSTEIHARVEEILPVLHHVVVAWFADYGRSFPWRSITEPQSPYDTLISECMLQQTQTSRVSEKLPIFLQQFPTVTILAKADNATIIRAWQGMGYNSRALRLRDCAREIVIRHGGSIPQTYDDLIRLPGIGSYTAQAILSFAYHSDIAVIDVNIRRVYARLLFPMQTTADTLSAQHISTIADRLYPRGQSSLWHQAMMDIGALYCTSTAPKCAECPLAELCVSAFHIKPSVKKKKQEPTYRGQPHRIWRGRIVELLRGVPPRKTLADTAILQKLFPPETAELFPHAKQTEDMQWLHGILYGLERDGIIQILRANKAHQALWRIALAV